MINLVHDDGVPASAELLFGMCFGLPLMAYFIVGCTLPFSLFLGLSGGFSILAIAATYAMLLLISVVPVDDKQFASKARSKVQCKWCNSSFFVNPPPELPAKQTLALAVTKGPARGQVFRLTKAQTMLGRSGADIVLYDPEVSRKHCVIEVDGATATLVDLGTTNGTFADGKRIDRCQLKHLSTIRIGATTLVFTVNDNTRDESSSPPTLVVRSSRD